MTLTLTEALVVLHTRGLIRSPWLPGSSWTDGVAIGWLCLGGGPLPGVGLLLPNVNGWEPQTWDIAQTPGRIEPVTDAPGTVGCLAALAREAWGDPFLRASTQFVNVGDEPSLRRWKVWRGSGWWMSSAGHHPTEGEAWGAALIARALEAP